MHLATPAAPARAFVATNSSSTLNLPADRLQASNDHLYEDSASLVESYQGQTIHYHSDSQGHLVPDQTPNGSQAFLSQAKSFGKRLILPPNLETSVSKDYLVTRGWQLANIFTRDAAGFAIAAAAMNTLVADPTWGAAVKGGAAMATFGLWKTYTMQATKFATSFKIDMAEKNPRAWMLASEMVCNLGTVIGALGALKPVTNAVPGGLLGVTLACMAVSTAGGVMRGAATANVTRRQALDGNLAQVNAANGNQEMIAGIASGMAGTALLGAINKYTSPAVSIPVLAAVVGVVGAVCISQWVKNLDYHPITETVLRDILQEQKATGQTPHPKADKFFQMMGSLNDGGTITLGGNQHPQSQERLQQLRQMYQGRNYLLDIQDGKSYVLLREKCSAEDRLQAVYQSIQLEGVLAGSQYKDLVQTQGQAQADQWATKESLRLTPSDLKPFLKELHDNGWSTDVLKFSDTGRRNQW